MPGITLDHLLTQPLTTRNGRWPAPDVCKTGQKERRQQQQDHQITKRVGAKLPSVSSKGTAINEGRYSYKKQRSPNSSGTNLFQPRAEKSARSRRIQKFRAALAVRRNGRPRFETSALAHLDCWDGRSAKRNLVQFGVSGNTPRRSILRGIRC